MTPLSRHFPVSPENPPHICSFNGHLGLCWPLLEIYNTSRHLATSTVRKCRHWDKESVLLKDTSDACQPRASESASFVFSSLYLTLTLSFSSPLLRALPASRIQQLQQLLQDTTSSDSDSSSSSSSDRHRSKKRKKRKDKKKKEKKKRKRKRKHKSSKTSDSSDSDWARRTCWSVHLYATCFKRRMRLWMK